jgi:HEAT repeat protein
MMKAMPTERSTSQLRAAARPIILGLAAGAVIFGASIVASAAVQAEPAREGLSSLLSAYTITFLLVIVLIGLFVYKRVRSKRANAPADGRNRARVDRAEAGTSAVHQAVESASSDRRPANERRKVSDRRLEPEPARQVGDRRPASDRRKPFDRRFQLEGAQYWEKPAEPAAAVYGAYRIDQEVGQLALGKPHRTEVIASRTPEDRRAIEASLIKALESTDASEDARQRLLQALEEYGFVARQNAIVLMGHDAWERSSAARVLGQIKSQTSLPFLIEALHDGDSVVRNQAVASLGSLKIPAAIGALLDIARRHPDIPAALLSETLSSCSVDTLSFLDTPDLGAAFAHDDGAGEPADLESGAFDLLSGSDDQAVTQAIAQLEGADEQTRTSIAQQLALHRLQVSVSALTSLVLEDPEPGVRSAALASLGSIDHESAFAAILIGLSDESRIVRAAAARTLTSVHFDRADAYVRVMETADFETLRRVARACVNTGIVAQATDRLASEDRRQAYEAFSLFSLLARAHETQPIINVIASHVDDEVRLTAIRVLNIAGQNSVLPKLRDLAAHENMPESVRTAILETLYKLEQDQPSFEPEPPSLGADPPVLGLEPDSLEHDQAVLEVGASDNEPVFLHNSP